ncbi:fibronectin type III domain-containing protein [Amycolatopsis sp. DG1A-15b]|uniref:fibronectin type III domain-containing protein n=1 Tax=Amycolatopsis sp. DG1A-15b TaxID=3052846 RepID=UPI00255B783D|nr:fibronectin type III domain-containing protein [Amycolatopsis sp. DG1A-15b]WIX92880.1 fibronectin type III domain-containing protein [Amycolatopsis sp. DG1A-15b]
MPVKPLVLVTLLAAGCSAPAPSFTATLTSPTDVVLSWPDDGAGHRVDYANDPAGPWTTLGFLPPHTTSYHHPDLIPETPFYYREQPFTGPVSAETAPGAPAAPDATRLHAVASGDTLTFTWADRSPDEAGFLLEIRRPGAPGFAPVEVTDPGTTTCALSLLPGEEESAYRLRALHYGPLSPVVHQTTGKER